MKRRSGLFEKTDDTFLLISYDKFIEAINKNNTTMIDAILDAKEKGYEFDINREENGKTALEILLEKKDFANAAKLIKAGAKVEIEHKVWVDDDMMSYPYGYHEIRSRNVFATLTEDDLSKLAGFQAALRSASDQNGIALRK